MTSGIEGLEDLSRMFSIFHDGSITRYEPAGSDVLLDIEINYLAERVSPDFDRFIIALHGLSEICFSTWPKDPSSDPVLLDDLDIIAGLELELLSGKSSGGKVVVVCNQPAVQYDFCGGELSFVSSSASVTDQAGKTYSLDELDALCQRYWDGWKKKTEKSRGA